MATPATAASADRPRRARRPPRQATIPGVLDRGLELHGCDTTVSLGEYVQQVAEATDRLPVNVAKGEGVLAWPWLAVRLLRGHPALRDLEPLEAAATVLDVLPDGQELWPYASREDVGAEIVTLWAKVKFPAGTMARAAELAQDQVITLPALERSALPGLERVLALASALASLLPEGVPMALAVRTVGELTGLSHDTAGKLLGRAVDHGYLELVRVYPRGHRKGSEYLPTSKLTSAATVRRD